MASAWIVTRLTRSGRVRYLVYYRLSGRAGKTVYGGTFTTRPKAEEAMDEIMSAFAAMRLPRPPAPAPRGSPERVYFAVLGDLVKIGVAVDPERRVRRLNGELVRVEPGGRERELELHRRFAALRVRGEWFQHKGELKRYLTLMAERT
jgi:hypothetical protein